MYEARNRGVATPLFPAACRRLHGRQLLLYIQFRVITNAAGNLPARVVFIVVAADRVKRTKDSSVADGHLLQSATFRESVYVQEVIFKMVSFKINRYIIFLGNVIFLVHFMR